MTFKVIYFKKLKMEKREAFLRVFHWNSLGVVEALLEEDSDQILEAFLEEVFEENREISDQI